MTINNTQVMQKKMTKKHAIKACPLHDTTVIELNSHQY